MRSRIESAINAASLPLVPHLPAICAALEEHGTVILRADPGSGKSTLVPLALLEHFGGKIVMLEPRRAAVLGIASRLAELLGEKAGETAGYAVRLERKVSPQTKIEVITEGLLVRRLQENP
ncbi:MAG: ATP-dependent helicase, partial [Treponema sp.]|nr:ATP-dependent helicase [Treponema sp.]